MNLTLNSDDHINIYSGPLHLATVASDSITVTTDTGYVVLERMTDGNVQVNMRRYIDENPVKLSLADLPIKVYIARYWNGYADDSPESLGVCATPNIANNMIAKHMATRDTKLEFDGYAKWWVTEWVVNHG